MSDVERYALLDDDRLVWQIPGDLGLEVARRWRILNDEVERLTAENARLAREREMLLFRDVCCVDDGKWYVRGVEFGALFPSREEAIRRFVKHLYDSQDWPSERRRREQEGWGDGR